MSHTSRFVLLTALCEFLAGSVPSTFGPCAVTVPGSFSSSVHCHDQNIFGYGTCAGMYRIVAQQKDCQSTEETYCIPYSINRVTLIFTSPTGCWSDSDCAVDLTTRVDLGTGTNC